MRWHEATSKLMNELVATKRDLQQKTIELQEALDQVKLLKGLLPICASCKKIRDDKGYWQSVEEYSLRILRIPHVVDGDREGAIAPHVGRKHAADPPPIDVDGTTTINLFVEVGIAVGHHGFPGKRPSVDLAIGGQSRRQ